MKKSLVLAFLSLFVLVGSQAFAGTATLVLTKTLSIGPISSPLGNTYYEKGTVKKYGTTSIIGHYYSERKNFGLASMPTKYTLIFINNPSYNMTFEGASYSNYVFYGSVAAQSQRYYNLRGASVYPSLAPTATTRTLTINWPTTATVIIP